MQALIAEEKEFGANRIKIDKCFDDYLHKKDILALDVKKNATIHLPTRSLYHSTQ